MSAAHSPGPWDVCHHRVLQSITSHGGALAYVLAHPGGVEVQTANARLIATTPDLLAELRHAVRFFDQLTADDAKRYSAVIEKATGAT